MARKIEVIIAGDASSLTRALGQSNRALGGFGRTLGFLATRGIVAGGAALGGLGVLSAKAAIDFESSFAGIRKTVNATEPQFEALERGIRNMAKEIPAGVNQLNEIGEMAGQLGIKRKGMLSFIRTIADLGETTNLVGEDAASTMARLANVMQIPQTNIRRLGSTIVALGNAGASTEAEIAEFALRIAGAGRQVGLTMPQVLGFGNALSSVGIEAEAGGTAISTAFVKMAAAVEKGGADMTTFAKVAGMSGQQFQKSFRDDAAGAMVSFIEGLARVKKDGGDVFGTLDKLGLGGVRVRDALLRASGAGDLLRDSIKLGNKAWLENTALTREAEKRYETTASQLKILRNRWTDLKITIGEALLPAINDAIQGIVRLAERVGAATTVRAKLKIIWEAASTEIGNLFDTIRGAVEDAVLGPERTVTIESENPLFVTFPSVKVTSRDRTWGEALKDAFNQASEETARFFEAADPVIERGLQNMADRFNNWAKGLPGRIVDGIRGGMNSGTAAGDQLAGRIVSSIGEGLSPLGNRIGTQVSSGVGRIRGYLGAASSGGSALGARIVTGVTTGLRNLGSRTMAMLSTIGSAIANVASRAAGWAASIGGAIITGVISGLAGLAGRVGSAVAGAIRSGVKWAREHAGSTAEQLTERELGRPLAAGVIRGAILGLDVLPDKIADKVNSAIDRARSRVEGKVEAFGRIFDSLRDRILRAFDAETRGTLTPAEAELRAIEERRERERLSEAIADAERDVAKAKLENDPEAIANAERRLALAKEDLRIAELRKTAERERLEFEAEREGLREKLEGTLDKAVAAAEKGNMAQFRKLLVQAFFGAGIDFETAGVNLGDAFVKGMRTKIDQALKAGKAIREAIIEGVGSVIEVQVSVRGAPEGRARGGPVQANRLYMVGESGPELFSPSANGRIVPGLAAATSGGNTYNFNNYAPIGSQREAEAWVRSALLRVQGRQGYTGVR